MSATAATVPAENVESTGASRIVPPSLRFAASENGGPSLQPGAHTTSASASPPPPPPPPPPSSSSEPRISSHVNIGKPSTLAATSPKPAVDEIVASPLDMEHAVPPIPSRPAPHVVSAATGGVHAVPRRVDPHATVGEPEDDANDGDHDFMSAVPSSMRRAAASSASAASSAAGGGGANSSQPGAAARQPSIERQNTNMTNAQSSSNVDYGSDSSTEADSDDGAGEYEDLWVRRSWLRDFAMDNFQCTRCRRLAVDPVYMDDKDLACRKCCEKELAEEDADQPAATAQEEHRMSELPSFVARAVVQLRNGLASALLLSDAADEERVRNTPKLDVNRALQIASEEQSVRERVALENEHLFAELMRRHQVRLRARQPGTSRQLKSEGDHKYEAQDYGPAYELYTRAIEVNDGTQKLAGMYANRSAALFMNMRFADCIADCAKAVELDPASAPKMHTRCQKAAVQLGDLAQAIRYAKLLEEASNGRVTDEQATERQRLQQGAERLEKLTDKSSQAEREETYKLLMTRFPEAQHFRCMYCEQCMAAGKFDEVIQKMHAGMVRTPKAGFLLAKALYMTGFEEFHRAKVAIAEFAGIDAECRALQETIHRVDEHKQKGNDLFSHKHFAESITHYSSAIELASTNGRVLRVLYCNRAAAFKEVGRFKEGVEDCTKAISFDAKFCKAFARRARCLLGCQDFQSAVRDFKSACELEPTDNELARELRYAERLSNDEIAKEKDLYHVLGVSRSAPSTEIKQRYRELSLKFHPDKCVGLADVQRAEAERKFKVINEAYQTLSNADSRAKYDMQDAAAHRRASGFGGGAGFQSDLFRNAANPNTNRYSAHHQYGAHRAHNPSSFF